MTQQNQIQETTASQSPVLKPSVDRLWVEVVPDTDPDPSYLYADGPRRFSERRAAYERGDFSFVGVQACAQIRYATEQGGWISGAVERSPGIWGIEDDSGEDYFREVGEEERAQLADMLASLGLSMPTYDGTLIYR